MAIVQRTIRAWSTYTGQTAGATHNALGCLMTGFVRFMAPTYHGMELDVYAVLADGNKVQLGESPQTAHGTTLVNHGLDASGELVVEVTSEDTAAGVEAFDLVGFFDNGINGIYNPVDITRYTGMYPTGATVNGNGNGQMVGFMTSSANPEKYGEILIKDATAFRLAPSTSGRMVLLQMSLQVEGGQAQKSLKLSVRSVGLATNGQYKPGNTVYSSSPMLIIPMGTTGKQLLQYTNVIYARGENDLLVTNGFMPTIENWGTDGAKVFNGTMVITVLSEPKAL